ncbi:DUF4178 domain-containing protein [Brunnivagina elsteri]|uniref:DUF4178 domain-containing protein n=1 Tax=Brunnivagina elsteri CCALA 953 TaxID=987040 RepID=A0A2A2TEC2_9CYAN|nr:DUF4178 domain-containing protein [Calothrix elsteri]PAX52104.1 hypothetical protein CK510_21100 [Calothrix elsteri CCALA 953]
MTLIFGILVLITVGTIIYLINQQQPILKGSENQQLPAKKRNPLECTIFNLEIGDIIQHMGIDWVVEGKLTYKVGAYSWFEYLLQDKEKIAWLSVEEDDIVEVALLEPTNQLDISDIPPQELNFAGEVYKLEDSGTAKMNRTGLTMRRTAEKCQYFDYEGSGKRVLSIEIWDGDIEVSIGEKISPRSLTILPGDGKTVYRNYD